MHAKAILFGDTATANKILKASSPSKHKKLGRKVQGFDEKTWAKEREGIVQEGNYWKFTAAVNEEQRTTLKTLLLGTGEKELVEVGSWCLLCPQRSCATNGQAAGRHLLGIESGALGLVPRMLRRTDLDGA